MDLRRKLGRGEASVSPYVAQSDIPSGFSTPRRCVARTGLRNESFPENQEVRPALGRDAPRVEGIMGLHEILMSLSRWLPSFQEIRKWRGV